jgi:glutaredoxin
MMRARFPFAFLEFTIALLALILLTSAANAQLYRWTDEKGGVHVTDTPPPANARSVVQKKSSAEGGNTAEQRPYELTLAMKDFPVVLYTAPNCKQPCARARDALNKRSVPFKEVQVWNDATTEELKGLSGANEVPTLLVGRSVNRGFEQGAYDALLDSARYPKAGTLPPRAQAAPPRPEGYVGPGETAKAESAKPVEEEAKATGPYSPGSRPPPRNQQKK